MKYLESLSELIFPQRCLSCGTLGIALCDVCRRDVKKLHHRTLVQMDVGPSLLVYSTSLYSSTASSILLSSKESGIRAADFVVKELISHSLDFYLSSHPADFLVPIPSRASMNRKRGRSYMAAITEELAHSHSIPLLPLLHHGRAVRDQSSISRQLRRNNLEGALVVDSRVTVAAHSSALLIDDLVTTGATLAEAARALRYAGIEVTAGVTAFVAKPLR